MRNGCHCFRKCKKYFRTQEEVQDSPLRQCSSWKYPPASSSFAVFPLSRPRCESVSDTLFPRRSRHERFGCFIYERALRCGIWDVGIVLATDGIGIHECSYPFQLPIDTPNSRPFFGSPRNATHGDDNFCVVSKGLEGNSFPRQSRYPHTFYIEMRIVCNNFGISLILFLWLDSIQYHSFET